MKIAIVIGHHEKSKGAFSNFFGLAEFDFYNKVAEKLNGVSIFRHDSSIASYSSRILDTATRINKTEFDLVVELHFNSFSNPNANGCETLFFERSELGRKYADIFSKKVNECTGISLRNQGLKPLSKGDRGYASVYHTKAPTILIEPFFGSNDSDCKKIGTIDNMAHIINDFLNSL